MAAKLLAKYGVEALKPHFRFGKWEKPKISLRKAADLKKQYLREGKEWPVPEEPKKDTKWGFGLKKKPKGHKHEKLAEQRKKDIEANLAVMDKRIADYRESLKIKNVSVWDKLFSTPKDIRVKAKNKRKLG